MEKKGKKESERVCRVVFSESMPIHHDCNPQKEKKSQLTLCTLIIIRKTTVMLLNTFTHIS